MNLLEHYVGKIYSVEDVTKEFEEKNGHAPHEKVYKVDMDINCYVEDVTKEFEEKNGHAPHEKVYKVDMDINCYGVKERVKKCMFEKEYLFMKQNGYYMA